MANQSVKEKKESVVKKETAKPEIQKEEELILNTNSTTAPNENDALKAQITKMQAQMEMMASLLGSMQGAQPQKLHNIEEKDVIFVSLCHNKLNLYTEANSKGIHYGFEEYGEEHPIPWSQAKGIVKNQMPFVEDGGIFYIRDEEFVNSDKILKKIYSKMIDKDKLENLFFLKKEEFRTAFNALSDGQREVFADLIMTKSQKGEDVDLNVVKIVGDVLKKDLLQELSFVEELMKTKK